MLPETPCALLVHPRRVPTKIQPTCHILICSVALDSHEDSALVVGSGDWKLETVVGTARVEYADGVVDGEAEDGASAGAEGNQPLERGMAYAVDVPGSLDDIEQRTIVASFTDASGESNGCEEEENGEGEAGW